MTQMHALPDPRDTSARPSVHLVSGVLLGVCLRTEWYAEKGKSLRRVGWQLRRNGPRWDAKHALIERAPIGSAEWRTKGEEIIAGMRETIQRLRELGRDAAAAADTETGWFCDKQIKDLETKIAETQATLARSSPNAQDERPGPTT